MMEIGFLNVYAYRPHGHHARYLAMLCKQLGWGVHSFSCGGVASACYVRELKGVGKSECIKCSLGGLKSFAFDTHSNAIDFWPNKNVLIDERLVLSSAYTLTRAESEIQRNGTAVREKINALAEPTACFRDAVANWLVERKIDKVVLFNGRMDLTRAALEACNQLGITVLTHERPFFGDGIIINRNDNCSSLARINKLNSEFNDKPLTEQQALFAGALAFERKSGGNKFEWNTFHANDESIDGWPVKKAKLKILVCPASKSEKFGHPECETVWSDNTDCIDEYVRQGEFEYADLLIRFHPGWAGKFGVVSGQLCREHYLNWCHKNNVEYIDSTSEIKTGSLIKLADLVILNGSNTVYEAGMNGIPSINLGPAQSGKSGACLDILSYSDIEGSVARALQLDKNNLRRKTLRYFFTRARREPYFTQFVRSVSVVECEYTKGANPQILADLFDGVPQEEPFSQFHQDESFEDQVISMLDNQSMTLERPEPSTRNRMMVERRFGYRFLDKARRLYSKGV